MGLLYSQRFYTILFYLCFWMPALVLRPCYNESYLWQDVRSRYWCRRGCRSYSGDRYRYRDSSRNRSWSWAERVLRGNTSGSHWRQRRWDSVRRRDRLRCGYGQWVALLVASRGVVRRLRRYPIHYWRLSKP